MKTTTIITNDFTGYSATIRTEGNPAVATIKRHLAKSKASDCRSVTSIYIDGVGHDLTDLGNGEELVRNGRYSEQPKNTAAQALRAIKSETRSQASRSNGAKGGRPRQDIVYARTYGPSTHCRELVLTVRGKWFITVDGRIENANASIDIDDARRFWDNAGYQIEDRP